MLTSKEELRKQFSQKDYEVSIFTEKGFIRKLCPSCSHHFWTLNPEDVNCGDTICSGGYKFLGKKGKNLNFDEAIKSLTDFFVKHGHTAIKDYPVVARWRADMEFTIASIADFQPWVLEGIIDPPANPLVVPQFCIRTGGEFSDIDNIGKTARHLTSFVMFGQHSFNSERLKGGYWMDRCIELNFQYLTEELGLKPEEITYSEGIWMGGGNFGPNLEAFAYGSELVNNVFIAYGFDNDVVKKLDMQVIDVGWGLERVSWFTQGTPTIYEAIFPKAIKYLQTENGYKVDKKLLLDYSKLAGLLAVEEVANLKDARKDMAKKLGLTFEDMERILGPQEAMYAIADHARTLSLTLADGAIPSNVGGGYNMRVLLRRIIALRDLYNLQFSIQKIFDLQIDHLSVSYPRIKERRELIHHIIDIEVGRYNETKRLGSNVVKQLLKQKKEIDFSTLVDLYQNRGINPLMVKEFAKKDNIEIDVPENFYFQIQEELSKQKKQSKNKKEEDTIKFKEDYSTFPSYYENVYQQSIFSKVLANIDDKYLILDKTVLYPTGGGQIHDTGVIRFNGVEYRVINVVKKSSAILHELAETCDIPLGSTVEVVVDWDRRMDIMRHHTAVHVVNNASRQVLGAHVWQAGADKTEFKARLDITHYRSISYEELQKIEYIANLIVLENRTIDKYDLDRDQAEKEHGFEIYQGGVVPGKSLHIVSISDWDIEACGGTHLDSTGEIGLIKLTSSERIQDGVVRIEILAGKRAVEYIQQQEQILFDSSSILSVEPKMLPKTVNKFFDDWKHQKKTIEKMSKQIAEIQFANPKNTTEEINGIKVILHETSGSQKELIVQATEAVKNNENSLCVLIAKAGGDRISIVGAKSSSLSINLSSIIREIATLAGGKGGGSGDVAMGGGSYPGALDELLTQIKEVIRKLLS